ncbi:MAG: preprotein translocase subunit SecE [Bdellovibrionota bacterium]
MSKSTDETGGNLIANTSDYFTESVEELKKISTPSRQETLQATLATIVLLVVVSLSLFLLDLFFGRIMTTVLS